MSLCWGASVTKQIIAARQVPRPTFSFLSVGRAKGLGLAVQIVPLCGSIIPYLCYAANAAAYIGRKGRNGAAYIGRKGYHGL